MSKPLLPTSLYMLMNGVQGYPEVGHSTCQPNLIAILAQILIISLIMAWHH